MDHALTTSRLLLRTANEGDAFVIEQFRERLSPWEPKDAQSAIKAWKQEQVEGRSIRFMLFFKDRPELPGLLGFCNFTQIFRGPFQACYLGYQIDRAHEGQGLMTEALTEAIAYMFNVQNIHRIMANYMPSNKGSARVLQKLGFTIEGLAKHYLLVNNSWEDHILTSLTNQHWLKR
jgi:[ribosomal protein S5]-alanine N-acetyltransferase